MTLFPPTRHDVMAALSRHIGAEKAIHADDLAELLGIDARKLREFISELREEGVAVCGHPSTGYYIAANAEELEETCQFLRSRAMHSLVLEARLRKIPLPDLIGQLHLET
jgi:predicted DNA-binding transcriptional regulator YafY